MLRATSLLFLVAVTVACAKKDVVQSSGSLLGATPTPDDAAEEDQKNRGIRDGDVTQGKGTGLPDNRRLPR